MENNFFDSLSCTTKKICTMLLLLLPILNQYKIAALSFIDICAIVVFLLCISKGKLLKIKDPWFVLFLLYGSISTLICSLFLHEMTAAHLGLKMIRFVLYMYIFYTILPFVIDIEWLLKWYTRIMITVTVLLFFQMVMSIVRGSYFNLLFPLPINYGDMEGADLSTLRQYQISAGIYRPASIFFEPAWYSLYALPWMALSFVMNTIRERKTFFVCVFVTCGILVSRSSIGILVAAILWFYFSFVMAFREHKRNYLFLLALIIIAMSYLMKSSIGNEILTKLSSNSWNTTSSFSLRVLRGIQCISQLDIVNLLFGVGYGNISLHFTQNGIRSIFDTTDVVSVYMNGISTMVCYFGVFGSVLYFIAFMKKNAVNRRIWLIIISWVCILIGSDYYDNSFFFVMVVLIQSLAISFKKNKVE